ncbi:hypothetical protein NE237_015287 [Protea cynaroides]|uniref:Uncharacterized protein n=1 Tax=Protea cynaroides TaxID=273540 RepID=A0A9Q0KDZ0_9MAGN|nr:hypothetical protein NE237_015287 [Protea cynaroides]
MAKTSERKNHNKRVQKQNCKSKPVEKRRKMTMVCSEPQMPPLLKRRIEEIAGVGTTIVWLNANELTVSDVNGHLDRLFTPKIEALKHFLNEKEIENFDRTKNRTKVVDLEGEVKKTVVLTLKVHGHSTRLDWVGFSTILVSYSICDSGFLSICIT